MKALSIKQPYASLIAHNIKDIENRTWKTHFRGRIYIHASAKEIGCLSEVLNDKQFSKVCEIWNSDYFPNRHLSAIIGEVDIIDCVINHESIWAEKTEIKKCDNCPSEIDGFDICCHYKGKKEGFIPYVEKPIYNWVLANPVLYDKPIVNVKGKLSFWETDYCNCEVCQKPFHIENMILSEDNWICEECLNEDLKPEELELELKRSKALCQIADRKIEHNKTSLIALKMVSNGDIKQGLISTELIPASNQLKE